MITTVTTTTITTITGLTSLALAAFAIAVLLALLMAKESLLHATEGWARRLSRAFNVAIIPLIIVFTLTVIFQLVQVLG